MISGRCDRRDGGIFSASAGGVSPRGRLVCRRRLGPPEALRALGLGVITGVADNDPGSIATYSVVEANVGFAQNLNGRI